MMPRISHRPFSKRHQKALEAGTLTIELSDRTRVRLWKTLCHYDYQFSYQPDPNDRWTVNTTGMRELPEALERIYGCEHLTDCAEDGRDPIDDELKPFFFSCIGSQVFDIVELFFAGMCDQKSDFQRDLNEASQEEDCHWILCDGYFLKLDSKWIEEHVLSQAHELLGKGKCDGALDELREARSYLAAEDFKSATHSAGKAMESLLKAILQREDGSAKVLIEGLKATNFYEGLPEPLVRSFGDSVLMALPYTRNKLAGHGQGSEVVIVPRSFAELAVNLSGTFAVFLINRHMEVKPEPVKEPEGQQKLGSDVILSDGIPF